MTHILQKLDARNRTEASIRAARLGLSPVPGSAHQVAASEPSVRHSEPWAPRRLISRRLVVPLLVALNGLLLYLAVMGSPVDLSTDGPGDTVAQAMPAHAEPPMTPP